MAGSGFDGVECGVYRPDEQPWCQYSVVGYKSDDSVAISIVAVVVVVVVVD